MYKIIGGNKLKGKIRLHGAKNAALPILAASALIDDEIILHNVPHQLNDVKIMIKILEALGKKVSNGNDHIKIKGTLKTHIVPPELGNKIRYSLLFLGVLLNRLGKSSVPTPGGCNIGNRKFDLHIDGLKQLGAEFQIGDTIEAKCSQLKGTEINFYLPTTSGTQNIILGALAAKGDIILKNANTRPENLDFVNFLNSMGADIKIQNRLAKVHIETPLHGTEYSIKNGPDELVTYIIAAAVTGGEIQIENADLRNIPTDVKVLRDAGVDIFEWGSSVYVSAKKPLKPIDIFTTPFPGINSDMQPLYSVFAAMAHGDSTVTDMRFTDRFQYVEQLKKYGIQIEVYGNCAVIVGGVKIKGCHSTATDIRGGAAQVLAALCADGESKIDNIYQIERGYMNFVPTLKSINANIEVE